jgi:hypothetical protein
MRHELKKGAQADVVVITAKIQNPHPFLDQNVSTRTLELRQPVKTGCIFFFWRRPIRERAQVPFFAFLVANWMILRNVTYEVNHGRTFVAAFNDPSRVHPQRPAVV